MNTIRKLITYSILSIGLSACSSNPNQSSCDSLMEFAARNSTRVPKFQPEFKYVNNVQEACARINAHVNLNQVIHACADPFGIYVNGKCLVILSIDSKEAEDWRCHEVAHCFYGYYHPQ